MPTYVAAGLVAMLGTKTAAIPYQQSSFLQRYILEASISIIDILIAVIAISLEV